MHLAEEESHSYRPPVSILIPAFNAEPWIRECVDSALNQTYSPVEVIVVDDGSTDRTTQVVEEFGPKVHLIRADHQGGNVARNILLRHARGEWLQYLDADDYLLPHKISAQMQLLDGDTSLDVICSPVILRDERDGSEKPLPFSDARDVVLEFLRWGSLNTTGFLYRKSALIQAGGWDVQQPACQEHELLFRIIAQNRRVACLPEPGSVYRFHGVSTVSRKDPLRTARLQAALLDKMHAHLQASDRLSADYRTALYVARMQTARKTWPADRAFASALAQRALSTGHPSKVSSPALPFSYRIMHTLFGFSAAERVAASYRRLSAAFARS